MQEQARSRSELCMASTLHLNFLWPTSLLFLSFSPKSQALVMYTCLRNTTTLLMSYPCIQLLKVKGKCTLYLNQANNSQQCQCKRTTLSLTLIGFLVGCRTFSRYGVFHNYKTLGLKNWIRKNAANCCEFSIFGKYNVLVCLWEYLEIILILWVL